MEHNETPRGLVLTGLDGANPLGFLAAIGTAVTAQRVWPGLRVHWRVVMGCWRPVLTHCEQIEDSFLAQLHAALLDGAMNAFDVNAKLPFPVEEYIDALTAALRTACQENRRDCDFLAAFGTEMYPKPDSKKVFIFRDTRLRMVRSGDAAGQGFPIYAKAIRQATEVDHLRRTLFAQWDCRDSGFSLRWDPIEDQRYALRWRDPSKSGLSDGPGVMLGANSLAIESLQCMPTVPVGTRAETTGFSRARSGGTFFRWPIWTTEVTVDIIRSLLALPALHKETVPREELAARGIAEIYQSQRIQQNQYYSNFAPSHPV